jgi:hypothetical protein
VSPVPRNQRRTPKFAKFPVFTGIPSCASTDLESWFPDPDNTRELLPMLRSICQNCEVLKECREYALAYRLEGFWGGMTAHQRVIEQGKRGIKPLPVFLTPADHRRRAG